MNKAKKVHQGKREIQASKHIPCQSKSKIKIKMKARARQQNKI